MAAKSQLNLHVLHLLLTNTFHSDRRFNNSLNSWLVSAARWFVSCTDSSNLATLPSKPLVSELSPLELLEIAFASSFTAAAMRLLLFRTTSKTSEFWRRIFCHFGGGISSTSVSWSVSDSLVLDEAFCDHVRSRFARAFLAVFCSFSTSAWLSCVCLACSFCSFKCATHSNSDCLSSESCCTVPI